MRIIRLTITLAAALLSMAVTARLPAQVYYPKPHEAEGLYQPLVDPEMFNPDYQFFQTVDYDPFHGTREYNTGFFGGYDRVFLWMSRPDAEQSYTEGDFTWGNRYEYGYMTDEHHGWLFTHWRLGNPGASDNLRVERLNRLNEDDIIGQIPPDVDPGDLTFPVQDRNNHEFDAIYPPVEPLGRDYILRDSLNAGDLSSFEVNKTFRLQPYHNGSVLEPFFGARYVSFRDFTYNDQYIGPFDTNFGTPLTPTLVVAETLIRQNDRVNNDMFGGQLGFRYFYNLQRWQWSNETRFFAMQNFQNQRSSTLFVTTGYGDIGLGEEPIAERRTEVVTYAHNAEFVFGIDVRAAASYQVTRDFNLRVGFEYMHFGSGIWRGPATTQNQDLILAGVTMGFELNR